jgi:OOP family OmpA-OmpF porin
MKITFRSIAILTATFLAGSAFAQTSNSSSENWMSNWMNGGQWYVGAKIGGNWIDRDTNIAKFAPGSTVLGTVNYDDGYIGALQFGYGFSNGLRVEFEGADRYNRVVGVSGYGRGRSVLRSYAAMINALYDMPVDFALTPYVDVRLKPYVGVGFGAATYAPDHIRADGMPYPSYFGGSRTNFAYQGIAGVGYNISDNITITAEYRYLVRPGEHPAGIRTDYQAQSGLFGIRYSFGAPAAERDLQARTYVPAPAAVPAPPRPRNYLVFFDFNKSDLTSDARNIVDKAAANAQSDHRTQLEVTGYTDTVGSEAYNMRLSRRRAESVSAELQTQGVPVGEIAIYAKGKHDLLVPTADGVREPQNRRVQIVYSFSGRANPGS